MRTEWPASPSPYSDARAGPAAAVPLAVVADIDTMSPQLWFVHGDHLNRPVKMTDGTKASVWDAVWLPYGGAHSISGSASNDARFPGQWFQIESGLSYNWHRHYDATTGRYSQADPLGFTDGPSLYAYVGGNPIGRMDFFGLDSGVIVWEPAGWGQSSFGHVSSYVNGTSYSFGPSGVNVEPLNRYVERNSFRAGFGFRLNLSISEEEQFGQCLSQPQGNYDWLNNSCTDPIERCLNNMGYDVGDSLTPMGLGERIMSNPRLLSPGNVRYYPASRPATGINSPWAK